MGDIEKGKKIAEGKTKIIWADPTGEAKVLIESKDDITAGDGAERNVIENKGILSTETTSNCFRLLEHSYIPTHFSDRVDERTFSAWRMVMIPLKLVVRRIATGSYLDRNPGVKEGLIFDKPVVEFFFKDDQRHDPLVIYDAGGDRWLVYRAHRSMSDGFIGEMDGLVTLDDRQITPKGVMALRRLCLWVFSTLEDAWKLQDVALVDLKIECGFQLNLKGQAIDHIVVADVIDNDSWRIWPAGDKSQMKDKQVYRDLEEKTTEALGAIKENYQWVAEATAKFIN